MRKGETVSVLETNIRIVQPGADLYLNVRRMRASGQNLDHDLLDRACGQLRRRRGLAATPDPAARDTLLVVSRNPVSSLSLKDDEWELQIDDVGDASHRLLARDCPDTVASLVERSLLVSAARVRGLWSFRSPRIWYEERPIQESEGIAAHRRYDISAIHIEDVGIGVIADVGMGFFSQHDLNYYFDQGPSESERKQRVGNFDALSNRQQGQKGTLGYNNGRNVMTCYFEDAPEGLTCQNTGTIVVRGQTYESLYHYYQSLYPDLEIGKYETAVRVSFPNLSRPQYVAARLLRLSVGNKQLPRRLSSLASASPDERGGLLSGFWDGLGSRPLGGSLPGLQEGFWRPSEDKVYQFKPPTLEFGKSMVIETPKKRTQHLIRENFRQRIRTLEKASCYQFPPAASRNVHVAFPETLEQAALQVADDLTRQLSELTGRPFQSNPVGYRTADEAYAQLRNLGDGLVLFILEDDPAAYYETSYNLSEWRVKRITRGTLSKSFEDLTSGAWDRKTGNRNLETGRRRWESFIRLNALNVLQLLDAIPFRTRDMGAFDSQLVIDVGYGRRFFAVSLLIARDEENSPAFTIHTSVEHKPDSKAEAINPVLLRDTVLRTFRRALSSGSDPLKSVLVIRDGRIQRSEIRGLDESIAALRQDGLLEQDSRVDIVGLHKSSLKNIRMWNYGRGRVSNVLEGTGVSLNRDTFILCTTGDATLRQGTARPIAFVGNGHHQDLPDVAFSAFASAQLNWSSPDVAQHLPLPLKRTDEELEARMSQEIRRVK